MPLAILDLDLSCLHLVYAQSMRGSFFTGFLTLSSFLLATKTLVVMQVRKDMYESTDYLKWHQTVLPDKSVYHAILNLANLLNLNILAAMTSSVLQFTLGFVPYWPATLICIVVPFATLGLTVFSVLKIRKNFQVLFEWLEARAQEKITSLRP